MGEAGVRLPRRLWEARVGATAAIAAPRAELWVPRYRRGEGFGCRSHKATSLVLQCSLVEDRLQGPSTRVSRRVLHAYTHPDLVEWRDCIYFVLAGVAGPSRAVPSDIPGVAAPNGMPSFVPALFAISLGDLLSFTERQGRGTVSSAGLDELRTTVAEGGARPAAERLESVITRFADPGAFDEAPLSPRRGVSSIYDETYWSWRDPFNRPMPIALRFP